MNLKRFEIKARYKLTNRIRTTVIIGKDTEDAINLIADDFIIPPVEIKDIGFDTPTENQLAYASRLGIIIPVGAYKEDVSCLIDKKLNNDSNPQQGLIEFATNRKILVSEYIGKKALYLTIYNSLPDIDKIAFFIFCIYRYYSDDRESNLDISPYKETFYSFAEEMKDNKRFMTSLNHYEGDDLRFFGELEIEDDTDCVLHFGGSVGTNAFKWAYSYLAQKNLVPLRRRGIKHLNKTTSKINTSTNNYIINNKSNTNNKGNKSNNFFTIIFYIIGIFSFFIVLLDKI